MKQQYEIVYPDARKGENEPSGGYVEVHILHNEQELPLNLETAVLFAKIGYRIRLLAVDFTPGRRYADALFIKESIQVEFKHNQKPTSSAIDNELRDAKKQAAHVVLHIRSPIRKGHLLKAIKSRIKLAPNIQTLWLI